jgi:hypothetical protein
MILPASRRGGRGELNQHRPRKAFILWSDVEWISFNPSPDRLSAFGGATAALLEFGTRGTRQGAHVAVALKSGSAAVFRIAGRSAPALGKKIEPFVAEHDKPILDD